MKHATLVVLVFLLSCSEAQFDYDVVIVGGGASGTTAGIQSARLGAKTLIVEETVWLGGMLTSAGVSAIDGNYKLPSGLWEEFRQRLYQYYGGPDSVKTGWVSNVLFEPNIAANILLNLTQEEDNLSVRFKSELINLKQIQNGWQLTLTTGDSIWTVRTKRLIDGTELGDVAAMAGVKYDIGMDSRFETGEEIAPDSANNITQDLTYVAVLQEYDEPRIIEQPEGYNAEIFACTCAGKCSQDSVSRTLWDCDQMMRYGKLPNNKYMINWPIYGNDYYINPIEMSKTERQQAYDKAKWFTRCYIYYMQTELGFDHYGIAEDVFPTGDGFPMFPYHRESRRTHGKIRFDINDLARPYEQSTAKYRTGIAVGDYPVDHHHAAYPNHESLPDLHFYPVPSYALPMGSLIPANTENLIVAEKSISVTNLVNGTTRLQPVCLLIGQAAGTIAALSANQDIPSSEISIRDVQTTLLNSNAYIQPYIDIEQSDPAFDAVQRIGSTGILKGVGKNIGWENMTFFYPDSTVNATEIKAGLESLYPQEKWNIAKPISIQAAVTIGEKLRKLTGAKQKFDLAYTWNQYGWGAFDQSATITRKQMCVLLDEMANPFQIEVDYNGNFVR